MAAPSTRLHFAYSSERWPGQDCGPASMNTLVWAWWNPLRLLRALFTARRVWRFRFRGYEGIKIAALKCYVSAIRAHSSLGQTVLSPEFVRLFQRPCEFYLEI